MKYFLQHNRPAPHRARLTITIAAAIVILIVLIAWIWPSAFPGLFSSIARPFWRARFSIQSGALRSPQEFLNENESLKNQLADLRQSIASSSVAALEAENTELRAMLNRASSTPSYVLAAVLVRPPLLPYDELIIDLGSDDGVSTTTVIYAFGDMPIGRASQVLSKTSTVALFSSPGERYNVLIGSGRVPATAEGKGGGQYEAAVPHGSAIRAGDFVIDSSSRNRPLGTVVSVSSNPADPFDAVIFAPTVNIYSLRWVLADLNVNASKARK